MKLLLAAVGRMKSGPARDLCDDYAGRVRLQGRGIGIRDLAIREFPESAHSDTDARRRDEGERVRAALAPHSCVIALDERGRTPSSREFAGWLSDWLDQGVSDVAFLIGGPDGHDGELKRGCDRLLSFGPMTWPHQMARAMLCEQLYRAVTILTKHPYHRD